MQYYRVCYRCRIDWARLTKSLSEEIDRSLSRIRRLNRRSGVTGALFLTDQHIIQVLEGAPGPVLDTVYGVLTDPRLSSLEAIFQEPAEDLLFPKSLMLFRDLTDGEDAARHPVLKPLLDRTSDLNRDTALPAIMHYSSETLEGRLTDSMLLM